VPATAGAERTPSLTAEQPAAETVGQAAGSDAAGAESPAAATVAAAESAKPVAAAGGQGAYLLQIGAYVLEANLEQTLKTVRALGYQPLVSTGKKTVAMTRLRVGAYPQKQASEKLRELKQLAPAAFLLAEGERMALYAGSYFGLDRARVEADLLYQHDIHIDEETVSVAIPIRTVRFGAFSDAAAAEIVAEQTKKAGLDALVIKSGSEAAELLSALGG
jgi:cell division septation protein DedD